MPKSRGQAAAKPPRVLSVLMFARFLAEAWTVHTEAPRARKMEIVAFTPQTFEILFLHGASAVRRKERVHVLDGTLFIYKAASLAARDGVKRSASRALRARIADTI